jgi:hypothetical protein
MVFVILNVQNDEKIGFRHISATVGYLSAFPFHLQARKLKALMESTFGWDLEDNAVNLIDEDDEVIWIMITSIIISPLLHIG